MREERPARLERMRGGEMALHRRLALIVVVLTAGYLLLGYSILRTVVNALLWYNQAVCQRLSRLGFGRD